MIRLRWTDLGLDVGAAAELRDPRLRRLAGAGPWTFRASGSTLTATMVVPGWEAADWTPWEPGLDGSHFAVATNPPPLTTLQTDPAPADAIAVDLACGERVWILPARRAPRRLGFGLRDRGPASAYGAAAFELSDKMAAGSYTGEDVEQVVMLALASVHRRLLPEVIVGRGLFADSDTCPILEAVWAIPKARAGDAISSSAPPASPSTT